MRWPDWFGKVSWVAWGALAVLTLAMLAFIVTVAPSPYPGPSPTPEALREAARALPGWQLNVAVTTLLTVFSVALIFLAFNRIGGARFEIDVAKRDSIYANALGLLCAGLFFATAMVVTAAPLGLGGWIQTVTRNEWIENNFELPLVAFGLALVLFGDWLGRSWVACAPTDSKRQFQMNVYSITFASAVGVIVLVMVGSSAFGARLAQLQIEQPNQTADRRALAMERAQYAAEQMIQIEQEEAAALREREILQRQEAEIGARLNATNVILFAAQTTIRNNLSPIYSRYSASPELSFIPSDLSYQNWSPFEIAALKMVVQAEPDSLIRQSALREIDAADRTSPRLESLREQADTEYRSLTGLTGSITNVERRLSNLTSRRSCVLDVVASFMAPSSAAEPPKPLTVTVTSADLTVPPITPSPPTRDCLTAGASNNHYSIEQTNNRLKAERVIDIVRPLQRSWMSDQLARRTPVALSIELVIIMGALGALLRMASERLLHVLVRFAPKNAGLSDSDLQLRDAALAQGNESTLHTLGLQIVFGMATALALFILLNVTINAASMQLSTQQQSAEGLNPFTMAGLGLLGGFSALNVAAWMGRLSDRMLANVDPPPPAQPPAAPPPPGV